MGSSFADEKLWYEIRDLFLGDNYAHQDIPEAIAMAKTCMHPDAQWLYGVFKNYYTSQFEKKEDAREILKSRLISGDTDSRTLCFYGYLEDVLHSIYISQAASQGYAFAQAVEASRLDVHDNETFLFAQQSALQGEREGFYWLAQCQESQNIGSSKKNMNLYKKAADLGDYNAMSEYACFLVDEKAAWNIWCKCFRMAACMDKFDEMLTNVVSAAGFEHEENWPIIFMIGRMLNEMYVHGHTEENYVKAVAFYKKQIEHYKAAVHTFSLCGLRLGLYKDVRVLIGKTIWNGREEAAYL